MKHLSTAAILAMLSTAAWGTVSEPPEPPRERPERPEFDGPTYVPSKNCRWRDVWTWQIVDKCDEVKPTAGPKGEIIFEGEVTP